MRRIPLALCLSGVLALAIGGCDAGRGPYVTATPGRTPSPAKAVTATPAAPTPTPAQAAMSQTVVLEMPPMPPGFAERDSALVLSSGAFAPGGEIPADYTCHGDNVSPALDWRGVPAGTLSLVLIMTDRDSSPADFVHWLVYNIPPDAAGIEPFQSGQDTLDNGALQGKNSYAELEGATTPGGDPISGIGYAGPCPPGPHRYVFRLYALDSLLDLDPGAGLQRVTRSMEGHVLAQAEMEAVFTPPR